jgi:signal transduction histidine kinase
LENSKGGKPSDVVLSMRNDGATRAPPDKDGRGLAGMRERVESLAGHFTVETDDTSAFGFVARIPVATGSPQ